MNFKQEELLEELFQAVKQRYPEIEMISITHSPDDPEHIWVNVTAPEDEDREIEMREFASDKETDILVEYGYAISIMPERISASA